MQNNKIVSFLGEEVYQDLKGEALEWISEEKFNEICLITIERVNNNYPVNVINVIRSASIMSSDAHKTSYGEEEVVEKTAEEAVEEAIEKLDIMAMAEENEEDYGMAR